MSIISDFLKRQKYRKMLSETQKRVQAELEPIHNIGLAIITAATNSRDTVKYIIKFTDEKDRIKKEMYIFFEFVYFYTHMTLRMSFTTLTEKQIKKMQEYLGETIPSVSIDSYCAHWPDDFRMRMKNDFFDKLNDAEIEYSQATRSSETKEQDPEKRIKILLTNLFMTVTKNILLLAGYEEDDFGVSQVSSVYIITSEQWIKMDLPKLILKAKEVL